MSPEEAMARINDLLAHAWMVRTFLKHADEIQENEEMLEVPRTLFDYCRAVEPSHARGDASEYVRRAKGKLSKLRKVVEYYAANYRSVSDHTNYQMADVSLRTMFRDLEATLASVVKDVGRSEPPESPGTAVPGL